MTEMDRLHFVRRMETIMDEARAVEQPKESCEASSVRVDGPNARVAVRDYIEINIHLHGVPVEQKANDTPARK